VAYFLKNPDLAVTGNISAVGASFTTISTVSENISSNAVIGNIAINGNVISSTNGPLQLSGLGNIVVGNISTAGGTTINSGIVTSLANIATANVTNAAISNATITSATIGSSIFGPSLANLGAITNVKITGGGAGNVIFTDGTGNLSFGNIAAVITGNAIPLGANAVGNLSSAVNVVNYTVTDAIAALNQFMGNITSIRGASTGILYATNLYGQLANASQPLITSLPNTVNIGTVLTSNVSFANGLPYVSTLVATDPSIVSLRANIVGANTAIIANSASTNANIVTANNAVVSYVNTLHSTMISNVNAANAAIVTANAYATGYADTLNAAMIANVTAANNAIALTTIGINSLINSIAVTNTEIISNIATVNASIVTANNAVVSYVNTLNSAMVANITATNAAIVTSNTAITNYVNTQFANIASYITAADNAINQINANIASFETYANLSFVSGNVSRVYTAVGNAVLQIDSFDSRQYTTAKYVIQATHQTNNGAIKDVQSTDMLVITNGTTVLQNEYAILSTSAISLFTPTISIVNGIVIVGVTPYYGNTTIDTVRIQVTSRL
jgi:hypothetical protein